jgi:hypothetical protein
MGYYRPHTGHGSDSDKPRAPQPHPPGKPDECKTLKPSEPPEYKEPTPCPPDCKCPDGSHPKPNCIEDLIARQDAEIAVAEKAKKFKEALVALLAKARAASQDYTQDRYKNLCKRWVEEDNRIAELIRKLECTVTCWRCAIECYICPLINQLYNNQQLLDGDVTLPTEVHSLYELQNWRARDKDKRERSFNRIQSVLAAWEKPAQTIDKILTDNDKLITDSLKLVGSDPTKVIYDIFFRLVPLHLAIAPFSGLSWETNGSWKTNILEEWTWEAFCKCDKGASEPDDCCGPDVGEWSMRQRLIGPQPYLIEPNKYFDLVCCLVEKRYEPAKSILAKAENDLAAVEKRITDLKAQIENGLKSFDKDAKATIPSVIDCDECKPTDMDAESS